jgi:hypothetical protein
MLAEMDLSQAGLAGDAALEKRTAMLEAARNIPGVTAAGTACWDGLCIRQIRAIRWCWEARC